jgi:hypothetical protein
MTIAPSTDDLFVNGPFPHLHRSLSLRRPPDTTVIRRALVVLLLGWVPLMILVVTDTLRTQSSSHSFITDFGVHARSLVAAPLLVLVEVPCLRRLEEIAVYFVHSGLVTEDDYPRFTRLLASTRSLMNSVLAEVVAALLAYSIVMVLLRYLSFVQVRPWYLAGSPDYLSWAGWWYALVSVPLLLILFFGWLWRVILWGRFLVKVAALKLRMIAAHPDRTAGLKFLNSSLFAFAPVAFTIGVVAAGSAATRVHYLGPRSMALKKPS